MCAAAPGGVISAIYVSAVLDSPSFCNMFVLLSLLLGICVRWWMELAESYPQSELAVC